MPILSAPKLEKLDARFFADVLVPHLRARLAANGGAASVSLSVDGAEVGVFPLAADDAGAMIAITATARGLEELLSGKAELLEGGFKDLKKRRRSGELTVRLVVGAAADLARAVRGVEKKRAAGARDLGGEGRSVLVRGTDRVRRGGRLIKGRRRTAEVAVPPPSAPSTTALGAPPPPPSDRATFAGTNLAVFLERVIERAGDVGDDDAIHYIDGEVNRG